MCTRALQGGGGEGRNEPSPVGSQSPELQSINLLSILFPAHLHRSARRERADVRGRTGCMKEPELLSCLFKGSATKGRGEGRRKAPELAAAVTLHCAEGEGKGKGGMRAWVGDAPRASCSKPEADAAAFRRGLCIGRPEPGGGFARRCNRHASQPVLPRRRGGGRERGTRHSWSL